MRQPPVPRTSARHPWRVAVQLVPGSDSTTWRRITFATPTGDLSVPEWVQRASPSVAARLVHVLESGKFPSRIAHGRLNAWRPAR